MKKILLLSLIIYFSNNHIFADGCAFAPGPEYYVAAPSQKAVISWTNGEEKMIIATKIQSQRLGDFGWVIPIKSTEKPEVELSEIEVFYILNQFLRPHKSSFGFGCASSVQYKSAAVEVIEAKELDIFDIVILKASQSDALYDWLQQNNFKIPARAEHILKDYTNDNFFFIAVKLDLANQHSQQINMLKKHGYYDYLDQLTTKEAKYPYYNGSVSVQIIENALQNEFYKTSWDRYITENDYNKIRRKEPQPEADLEILKNGFEEIGQIMLDLKQGISNPLLISFKTDKAFFPLKISQINKSFVAIDIFLISNNKLYDQSDFLQFERRKILSKDLKKQIGQYLSVDDLRYLSLFTYHGESINFTHDICFDE
ncbi:MAG: DUF2330 domain-containing protein [Phycisphaerae bacterium]|nr:DUF2330 domain-containing protein [Phycisphaerae bacterium]